MTSLADLRAPPELVAWLSSHETIECPRGDWSIYLAVAAGTDMRTIVRAACGVLRDVLDGYETEPAVAHVLDVAMRWTRGQEQGDRSALAVELHEALEAVPAGSDISGEVSAMMRVLGALQSVIGAIDAIEAVTEYPTGSRFDLAGRVNATSSLADAMYSAAAAPIEGDQVSIAYDDDGDVLDPERFATNMRTLAVLFRAELAG